MSRRDYDSPLFTGGPAPTDPIARFGEVLERAREHPDIAEPYAVSLATVGENGRPANRVVLLRGFDERGFAFYTNLESRKGRELAVHPHAALCFHWQPLELQVRAEGQAAQVEDAEADAYFASRPRGSQIGAWASLQSARLESRADLEARVHEIEQRFTDQPVPRPPFWSGFRVAPERIEFWYGQPSRLHHRDVYLRDGKAWTIHQLYP